MITFFGGLAIIVFTLIALRIIVDHPLFMIFFTYLGGAFIGYLLSGIGGAVLGDVIMGLLWLIFIKCSK
nr:MAG TPA: hypothetical protein [Caudoviricetes sp.]